VVLRRWILRFFLCICILPFQKQGQVGILQLRFLIWANLGRIGRLYVFIFTLLLGLFLYPYSIFFVLFSVRFGA